MCSANEYVGKRCGGTDTICLPQGECGEGAYLSGSECLPLTNCPPGTGSDVYATENSDQVCRPCQEGYFSTISEPNQCQPWRTCRAGTYIARAGTNTRNRICNSCRSGGYGPQWTSTQNQLVCNNFEFQCEAGSFLVDTPQDADPVCRPWRTCTTGSHMMVDGTPTTDRECCQCELNVGFATSLNSDTCEAVTTCRAGHHESSAPTLTSDRSCSVCHGGTYQDQPGALECFPVSTCGVAEFITVASTHRSDVVCAALTQCLEGAFEAVAPTETTNRICGTCSTCSERQYYHSECVSDADAQCRACSACSDTQFKSVECRSDQDTICLAVLDCPEGEYETDAPTSRSNRQCTQLSSCDGSASYESVSHTATSDRECTLVRECADGYESAAPTPTTDRVCLTLSGCDELLEFQSEPSSQTTDRVCQAATICQSGEFEFTALSATIDRTCAPCDDESYQPDAGQPSCISWQPCPLGNFIISAMTPTSARVCQEFTECLPLAEYEITGTATSDHSCVAVTYCSTDEFEVSPNTATSDRMCASLCEAGMFRPDGTEFDNSTACVPLSACAPGSEEITTPTATTDRLCRSCGDGTYQDEPDLIQCKPASECSAAEFEAGAATTTSDRTCAVLRRCDVLLGGGESGSGEFIDDDQGDNFDGSAEYYYSSHTATTDRECIDATVCGTGQGVMTPLTRTSDRTCTPCDGISTFSATAEASPCMPVRASCGLNEYGSNPPTVSSDRTCATATVCNTANGTEYTVSGPSATADRACGSVSTCHVGTVETVAPTATTDRACDICDGETTYHNTEYDDDGCQPTTPCRSGTYEMAAATVSSDRLCRWLSPCDTSQGAMFIAEAMTTTTDRVCRNTRTCARGSVERTPPSSTSDRRCRNCNGVTEYQDEEGASSCNNVTATCPASTYQVQHPTSSTDRLCGTVTSCPPGSMIEVQSNSTSDATCSACDGERTYQDTADQPTCLPVTICRADADFEASPPSASADRTCQTLTACEYGEEIVVASTPTSDRECQLLEFDTTITAALSNDRIAPVGDAATALRLINSEADVTAILRSTDGERDMSTDPRLTIEVLDQTNGSSASGLVNVVARADGSKYIRATGSDHGAVRLRISLDHIMLVAEVDCEVLQSSLEVRPLHPEFFAQAGSNILVVRRIDGAVPAAYQPVMLAVTLALSNGTTVDMTNRSDTIIDLEYGSGALARSVVGLWEFRPSSAAGASLTARIGDATSTPLSMDVMATPPLAVARLSGFNLQQGIVALSIEFENGWRIGSAFSASEAAVPGLVQFTIDLPEALAVSSAGRIAHLGNGYVTVTAIAGAMNATTSIYVNLEPEPNGLDIGAVAEDVLVPQPTGHRFDVPVFANSIGQPVGTFQIGLDFDPRVVRVETVTSDIVVDFRVSASNASVVVVGCGTSAMIGPRVLLFNVRFASSQPGSTHIRATAMRMLGLSAGSGAIEPASPHVSNAARAVQVVTAESAAGTAIALTALSEPAAGAWRPSGQPQGAVGPACVALPGDVDSDCTLTADDVNVLAVAMSSGRAAALAAADPEFEKLDVDGNGAVQIDDLAYLIQLYLGRLDMLRVRVLPSAAACTIDISIEAVNYDSVSPRSQPNLAVSTVYVGIYSYDEAFQDVFDSSTFSGASVLLRGPQSGAWPHFGGVLALSIPMSLVPFGTSRQLLRWTRNAAQLAPFSLFMLQERIIESGRHAHASKWYFGGGEAAVMSAGPSNIGALSSVRSTYFEGRAPYREFALNTVCSSNRPSSAVNTTTSPADFGVERDASLSVSPKGDSSLFFMLIVAFVAVLLVLIVTTVVMRSRRLRKSQPITRAGDHELQHMGSAGRDTDGFADVETQLEAFAAIHAVEVRGPLSHGYVPPMTSSGVLGHYRKSVPRESGFGFSSASFYTGVPSAAAHGRPSRVPLQAGDLPGMNESPELHGGYMDTHAVDEPDVNMVKSIAETKM